MSQEELFDAMYKTLKSIDNKLENLQLDINRVNMQISGFSSSTAANFEKLDTRISEKLTDLKQELLKEMQKAK